jgi:acetyl coenzyme A synthetase (ADP forming)-like protein
LSAYPSEYEFDVVLRDGEVAQFRPIKPTDGERMLRMFERMGPESRYFRFFRVKRELTPEELDYFTDVDYSDRMAIIVCQDGEMVGVGRYDRAEDAAAYAEVAFAVDDAHQGRGIGTQLLQLLTVYGRAHGITGFRAFVLPENVGMMRVFRNSGFALGRTLEEGIYTVDFPVEQTEDALAREQVRERRAVAASVLPILYPRSVAVVGASRSPGSIGSRLLRNLVHNGFTGPVYPVNPSADVVNSIRAYPSVGDIPGDVDLAIIVVPSPYVLSVVEDCAEKGVRGLVVISAGFSEIGGDGVELERKLLEQVRSAGMRMVGPNCMGVLNTSRTVSMNGTFAPVYPPRGNVAMSSQSGALGIAILDYAHSANIGISSFVSVGNKADISGNDLLLAWEEDPATDVIVLYLESFGNPRKFARVARRVARTKPIVAVKSGRTAAGTRAASSHTGALASVDIAVDALFHQTGVIRTNTLEELFDVAQLLANQPVPRGRRVGVITNAGGPGILAADALESNGLIMEEFSEGLQKELRSVLSAEASVRNPVDMIASAGPEEYIHTLKALLESDEIDALMAIYIPTTPEGAPEIAGAVREALRDYDGEKTFLSVFMQSDDVVQTLAADGTRIPTYLFPESAALALARAVRYGEWLEVPEGTIPQFADIDTKTARYVVDKALDRLGPDGGWLEAGEVRDVLAAFGVGLPLEATANSADEAVEIAESIGGPVAVKVLSPSAIHKSDVGGVLLDIEGEDEVRRAFERVRAAVDDPEGVLIQQMVAGGHEVLIGMTESPSFGPLLAFGLGGVYVELLKDVAFRVLPLNDLEASTMVKEVKGYRLLEGYRGMPSGDVQAVEEALLRVSALIEALPELVEMDLNPVKVLEPGEGVQVVDARLRVRPIQQGWAPELVDIPSVANRARQRSGSAGCV